MKKFKITAEEYDFICSKVQSLEAENNRLKGYIEGLKEQLRIANVVGQSKQLVECSNCNEVVEMISTGEFCPKCFC